MSPDWYIDRNGIFLGPFSHRQLLQLDATGGIKPGDLVGKHGKNWVTPDNLRHLFHELPHIVDESFAQPTGSAADSGH